MSACVNDTDGDGNCPACARNPEAPCRAGARGAIDNLGDCYLTPGVHKRLMTLMDAYAHELAEKIRVVACEEIDRQGPRTSPADQKYDKAAGMVKAADLIDPEVLNSGV